MQKHTRAGYRRIDAWTNFLDGSRGLVAGHRSSVGVSCECRGGDPAVRAFDPFEVRPVDAAVRNADPNLPRVDRWERSVDDSRLVSCVELDTSVFAHPVGGHLPFV
jgi:hypothetical protein